MISTSADTSEKWKVSTVNPGLKVVHYLNQFFGGIGGEDKAYVRPQVSAGPTGPGRAIRQALGDQGEVVATVTCGDNYFAEKSEQAAEEVIKLLEPYKPDVVIAGPAFEAGRYGVACGTVCKAVQDKLGIPAVTGMYKENPGVDLFFTDVYIIQTGESVRVMGEAISKMVNLARKLATNQKIGKPTEEGYFPRGIVKNERVDKNAAQRAVDMVLAKIKGESFEPELELPRFDRVKPASAIKDLASAKIALVTDGGLVPKGNPDKMESGRSTRFAVYSIKGLNYLTSGDYEANHTGYDEVFVNQDPNRLVPLDAMRDLEKEGTIGKLQDKIYTTAGVATPIDNAKNIGQGIAEQLQADGVDAVILTST